jgi:DNA-binding response OmpR family regulator
MGVTREAPRAERDGGLRALVVEDEPDMRGAIAEVLAERGHGVLALGDGAAAWEALRAERFPLMVLDLGLPGIDGLELCRRLRALPGGDATVVVVLTARTAPADLGAVLDAGADDYLAKPFDVGMLDVRVAVAERRVAEVARRRRAEAELTARARLDGAVKTARTVVDRLGDRLGVLVADADLLPAMVRGEARERAAGLVRGAHRAAATLAQLERLVRFVETVKGDEVMLDLEAATARETAAEADRARRRGKRPGRGAGLVS